MQEQDLAVDSSDREEGDEQQRKAKSTGDADRDGRNRVPKMANLERTQLKARCGDPLGFRSMPIR
jgi:hypothetical protein